MRLQKFLSRAGVASRRQAEGLIVAGRVQVNGQVVRTLGSKVVPGLDQVAVDGRPVREAPARTVVLNKPAGVLCTRSDPGGGRTVFDLLENEDPSLRYVGRLDRDTEGLLILTNQGDLAHALTHPSREVEREYEAEVADPPSEAALVQLTRGVLLDDGPARARSAELEIRQGTAVVRLVMTEGRKREVRRLLAAVGHPVRHLRRVRFGPLTLGTLDPGTYRSLTPSEIERLTTVTSAHGPD